MLGIFLIYFIGKQFYNLAHDHGKSEWGFAILGVVVYYLGIIIGGVILGVLIELAEIGLDGIPDLLLGILAIPLGLIICWCLYMFLKKLWNQEPKHVDSDILDQEI